MVKLEQFEVVTFVRNLTVAKIMIVAMFTMASSVNWCFQIF